MLCAQVFFLCFPDVLSFFLFFVLLFFCFFFSGCFVRRWLVFFVSSFFFEGGFPIHWCPNNENLEALDILFA